VVRRHRRGNVHNKLKIFQKKMLKKVKYLDRPLRKRNPHSCVLITARMAANWRGPAPAQPMGRVTVTLEMDADLLAWLKCSRPTGSARSTTRPELTNGQFL
jgi:hypothetical protein